MRITTKGQVTIPQRFREHYGLLAQTEVEFRPVRDGVKLVKAGSAGRRGKRLIEHMTGRGDGKLTTAEIMALTRGDT